MKKPSAQLLRAFLFAIVLAGGVATVGLIAQSVCGNPLACFEPGQEGEIWQGLTPFGETNDAACTNSVHPDPARVRGVERQCVRDDEQPVPQPYTVLMPPSLGQFLDPFGLAVDGERIYISDQSNHRIQVFKFDGTPIPIAHPIGDGVPGSGTYGPYPADSRMTGHNNQMTGQRLYAPDGLAVDAAGKLIVGDYSGYINIFNPDGSPAFGTFTNPERLLIVDSVGDNPSDAPDVATGIAMTPGTVIHGIGVAPPPGDNHRIFVTNRNNCFVQIYDSGFNLLRQIPEAAPSQEEQGSCYWDEEAAPLGVFSSPVAAAIDAQGHVYISDYDNNRIQILDLQGNSVGEFGRELFQYPWGVVVDHKGRVAVADTENQRIAVFTVDYSGSAPVASFVFELDAKGTLDGSPTAIAAQQGTGAGLDPAGRFIATDTLNNRIQRFHLPDLAIINKVIDPAGFGSFQVVVPEGKAAPVEYVGVSAVGIGATVLSINGVDPGNTAPLDPMNTAVQNATVALGTTIAPGQVVTYNFTFTPDPGETNYNFVLNAVGNDGETAADAQDIEASLPCLDCDSTHTIFVAPGTSTPATMTNGWYNTQLTVRINATTTHPDGLSGIAYQFLSGPEAGGQRWGGSVHLKPVSGNDASIEFSVQTQGVSSLRYWAIGADGTVEPSNPLTLSLDLSPPDVVFGFPAANPAGWNNVPVTGTWLVSDSPSGPAAPTSGSLSFPDEGRLQFQTVNATDRAGNLASDVPSNLSHHNGRYLNIDLTAPVLTPPANLHITIPATGAGYAIAPATFVATATDPDLADPRTGTDKSGSGVTVLLNPGMTQFPVNETTPFVFTATDAAGNTSTANGSVTVSKATSTISAGNVTVGYGQPTVVSAQLGATFASGSVTFTFGPNGEYSVAGVIAGGFATASVPPVLLAGGSYPMQVTYPGDNSVLPIATVATVTVVPAPVVVRAVSAGITYGDATPVFGFTYGPLPGGMVATDIDRAPTCTVSVPHTNAGTYSIVCANAADPNLTFAYEPAPYTVATKAATLTINSKSRVYGAANPALDAVAAGLVPGDTLAYTLSTTAGLLSPVGVYPITVAFAPGSNPNYAITVIDGTLSVGRGTVTITANSQSKVYGADNPDLDATVSGLPVGASVNYTLSTTATQFSGVGTYPITVNVNAVEDPNYAVVVVSNILTVGSRTASITALNNGKIEGTPDPALLTTSSGFLATDGIIVTATRVSGETPGSYVITPTASGDALGNYAVTPYPGVFTITPNNRPPVCGSAYGGEIWPPNHKRFYAAPINGVSDPDGGPVTILVTGIYQDEQIDSTGDGKFSPDGNGVGTSTAWVRAERNGHQNKAAGNGRVYEILFTATDNQGAQCTGSVLYGVPHNRGQRNEAIDSGLRIDSTGVVPGARDKSQIHQNSPQP